MIFDDRMMSNHIEQRLKDISLRITVFENYLKVLQEEADHLIMLQDIYKNKAETYDLIYAETLPKVTSAPVPAPEIKRIKSPNSGTARAREAILEIMCNDPHVIHRKLKMSALIQKKYPELNDKDVKNGLQSLRIAGAVTSEGRGLYKLK